MTCPRGVVGAVLTALALVLALPEGPGAQPTDVDVYVAEAILAVEDRQWDKALDLLRKALARAPDHVEALYYTGVAYMGKKQPAEAVPVLERALARSPAETSIAYQLGLAYFALERYQRAAQVLEPAFARQPDLESLGYYVGFLRYRAGRYKDALAAFRASRTADPEIAELTRLYAGLSLRQLGLASQAEAELSQIGQLRPASPLTGPVERLKGAITTARQVPRRFRAEVRAGFFYDDNAGAEPDRHPTDAAVRALRQGNRETTGELVSLSAEYDWLRAERWLGTVGLGFVATHNNRLPSFDIQDYSGLARLVHDLTVFDLTAVVSGTYSYDYLVLDNDEFVQRHAVTGSVALTRTGRQVTFLQGRVEVKEYSEVELGPLRGDESLDAVNYLVGLVHYVQFDRGRHLLKAGYQFDIDDARGSNYAYHGHRLLAGAQYTLPWAGVRLSYDFDLHYRDYLHRHTLLPLERPRSRERSDHEYTHTARIEVPLPWFTPDQGFFVTAEYVGKFVDSNIAAFEYDRNYGALFFTWRY